MSEFRGSIDSAALLRLKEKIEDLKRPIRKVDAEEVGRMTILEMKKMITVGLSPIRGNKRFPRYKNPAKYPKNKKPRTPVNLTLTGDFLRALTYDTRPSTSGYATEIYYAGREDVKEQGHREGANGQPERPTVPMGKEEFAVRIERVYARIYRDRIREILKRKN